MKPTPKQRLERFIRLKGREESINIHCVKPKFVDLLENECDGTIELSIDDTGKPSILISKDSPIEIIAEVHRREHEQRTVFFVRFIKKQV